MDWIMLGFQKNGGTPIDHPFRDGFYLRSRSCWSTPPFMETSIWWNPRIIMNPWVWKDGKTTATDGLVNWLLMTELCR